MRDSLGRGKETLKHTGIAERRAFRPGCNQSWEEELSLPELSAPVLRSRTCQRECGLGSLRERSCSRALPIELTGNLPSGTCHKSFLWGAREALHQRHFTMKPPGGTVTGHYCWPQRMEISGHQSLQEPQKSGPGDKTGTGQEPAEYAHTHLEAQLFPSAMLLQGPLLQSFRASWKETNI